MVRVKNLGDLKNNAIEFATDINKLDEEFRLNSAGFSDSHIELFTREELHEFSIDKKLTKEIYSSDLFVGLFDGDTVVDIN